MKKALLGGFATLVCVSLLGPVQAADAKVTHPYQAYQNERFGYTLRYPSDIFTPMPEAPNGDGREYVSQDKKAILRVWGSNFDAPLKEQLDSHVSSLPKGTRITYRHVGKNAFVLSGYLPGGKTIFYTRVLQLGGEMSGQWTGVTLEYPAAQKSLYNPIVDEIVKTFPGKISQ